MCIEGIMVILIFSTRIIDDILFLLLSELSGCFKFDVMWACIVDLILGHFLDILLNILKTNSINNFELELNLRIFKLVPLSVIIIHKCLHTKILKPT